MRHELVRGGRFLVLLTLALLVVVLFVPGRVELALRVYALVVCGLMLLLAIAALRTMYPPAAPLRPRRERAAPPRGGRPPTLDRIEQVTALAVAGSFDLHYRLRPRLRALALSLLAARRGISLDDDPEAAREILGDVTWELVRRDRPPPEDRLGRGLPRSELAEVVHSLERL